ncbi:hypothetical protein KL953_04095 [Mycolicibacterium goodii]|uniref:hypothetical protein n=1 Tax=Mycolicibacterium goodii TaxID=134601 RepID=UPI001BDDB46E|nr:hypothetical protein [Mycolicibacterium goodii]MBU8808065.1 hypothetical protein [Mycolicibacterium goodii]
MKITDEWNVMDWLDAIAKHDELIDVDVHVAASFAFGDGTAHVDGVTPDELEMSICALENFGFLRREFELDHGHDLVERSYAFAMPTKR